MSSGWFGRARKTRATGSRHAQKMREGNWALPVGAARAEAPHELTPGAPKGGVRIRLLANSARVFADKTVVGLEANIERMATLAGMSPSTVTPLNRLIGYEAAAKIAKHSVAEGITVREAVVDLGYIERGEVSEADLDKALDLLSMTHPGVAK